MDVSELPPLIAGRYRPVKKLGEGNMGFIFEVEHERTGERVALKLMRTHVLAGASLLERFKREARAAARIKSDHVVRVIDADAALELGGTLFMVMELLEGTDLDKAAAGIPQSPAVVVEWLRQAALGLDKAHQLGIVHRDLKPENLFLTRNERGDPRVKILDFGIAKTLEDAPGTTQSGQLLGTPLFMSPEQARTTDEVGPAADRYALGLIAYKLLSGVDYWEPAPNVAGIIAQILYHPMVPPSARGVEFGDEFDAWFARACNRDAAARFGSSMELVEALGRALGLRVSHTSFPSVSYGRIPVVAMDGLLIATPNGGSHAPTLSSATRDVTGTLSRMRQTRWVALAGIAFLVVGVAFWASRITTVPLTSEVTSETNRASEAHAAAAAMAPPPPRQKPPPPPEVSPVPPPAEVAAPEPTPTPKAASTPERSRSRTSAASEGVRKPSSAKPKKLAPGGGPVDDPLADQK
jgi:serine/threonine-protein kinase